MHVKIPQSLTQKRFCVAGQGEAILLTRINPIWLIWRKLCEFKRFIKLKLNIDGGLNFDQQTALSGGSVKKLLDTVLDRISDRQISFAIGKIYALKVGGAAMAYFVQLAVAFFLGAANYGVFALAWIIATTLGQICCSGFNDTTGRFLPGYLIVKDFARARGFVHFALLFTTAVSVAVATLLVITTVFMRPLLPEIYFLPVLLALVCVPALTFTHLKESIAVSRSLIFSGLFPTYILRPLVLTVFTALVAIIAHNNTTKVAVIGLLLASYTVAVIQWRFLKKPLNNELGSGEKIVEAAHWIKVSLPLFLAQGFFVLTTSADVLILSFFVEPEQLGIYFASVKMVALLSFIHVAVASGITRRLSEAWANNDVPGLRQQLRKGRIWMVAPTLVGAGFLVFSAPFLLSMFGPEFTSGSVIVTILIAGVVAQAAGGPIQEVLIVSGHQKAVSLIIGTFFVLNLILSLLLVKSLGMIGVAIASATTVSARIAIMYLFAYMRAPILSD